ncbi:type II toxin-antitoxin system HigB family toxin [Gloeocapsopsis crepidinum LEGE 06123]|uniref:Type II toxin-antitoxin system HigB family toxin n=1 Tax=Gloeocapsopsis crepidinum LEGE 06123 TaxID=588587 RepID=A0ABR9UY02_9CHRO|nr:type II toxin-antitoxin system HigB family toxin [Gloeocapsopsis crepidinum]MBE9193161.1 type II toxin-antitoxin system HigB family toxin [Gloeocapsopsis crepidinum LEGE 06123]
MHVISNKKLKEFYEIHSDAKTPLDNWYRIVKSAEWRNLAEVRQVFPSADLTSNFTIFNIKRSTYRLIVSIDYARQIVYVKYILTHAEYDKEKWKDDPYY